MNKPDDVLAFASPCVLGHVGCLRWSLARRDTALHLGEPLTLTGCTHTPVVRVDRPAEDGRSFRRPTRNTVSSTPLPVAPPIVGLPVASRCPYSEFGLPGESRHTSSAGTPDLCLNLLLAAATSRGVCHRRAHCANSPATSLLCGAHPASPRHR